MEAKKSRPRIGGLLAYLLLLLIAFPPFIGLRFWLRDSILGTVSGYSQPWRMMAALDGGAVLLAAIFIWFAVWRLWTRREARSVAVAQICLFAAMIAIIVLDYFAIGKMFGFTPASPLYPGFRLFSWCLFFFAASVSAYLYRSPRVARTYPSAAELEAVFD